MDGGVTAELRLLIRPDVVLLDYYRLTGPVFYAADDRIFSYGYSDVLPSPPLSGKSVAPSFVMKFDSCGKCSFGSF